MRLDVYLSEKGLAKSREAAKNLILSGGVKVNGAAASKPSREVTEGDRVEITAEPPKYVGRGGYKLEKALSCFGISLEGRVCLDIGASTGGFTDCMLQSGAAYVYALDVGHGQLDGRLIADSRVKNMEGVNIRGISAGDFEREIDFISADVSFISLRLVIPVISSLLREGAGAVMLIKPQFECGRADIGKKGIVRSEKVHERVLGGIISSCGENGLAVWGLDYSPIKGGDGNIEYLLYAGKSGGCIAGYAADCAGVVAAAKEKLRSD